VGAEGGADGACAGEGHPVACAVSVCGRRMER
jgi:hypothetical protein